ncbi:hypothetical protein BD779DRAFT_1569970 [Infundibulicybe gibba]|nr:hypothetical protein BD779DRAFT_1569970 [Infundibulicybe gibba]
MNDTLLSDIENMDLDDDDEETLDQIRAELKRINETLILSVMEKNQPYAKLPYQYTPNRDIDHRPPVFLYGLGFTYKEVYEYIIRTRLPISTSMGTIPDFSRYLDELFGVEMGTMHGVPPTCRGLVVFRLRTNYYNPLPKKKMEEIADTCDRVFQRRPMWYVGSARKKDYRISESDFFRSREL